MLFREALPMSEVAALVEGQAEQEFVDRILKPHLMPKRVYIWARLPGSVSRQGGVRTWRSIQGDVLRTLKERRDRYVTTMFDFYGMPKDWPGREEASTLPWDRKGECVESALLGDIESRMGNDLSPERFIPYIQVHEFEAILFSDVHVLNGVLEQVAGRNLLGNLQRILAEAGDPEAINDDPVSAPSKRLASLAPAYRKRAHGVIVAERLGLEKIRTVCPNFNRWLTRLESLG
jgi:hypothetical protein